jgi:hypothetical protein
MKLVMEYYREPLIGWLYLRVLEQKDHVLHHFSRENIREYNQAHILATRYKKHWWERTKELSIRSYHEPGFTMHRRYGRGILDVKGIYPDYDHRVISVHPLYADLVMEAILAYNQATTNNTVKEEDVFILEPTLEKWYLQQHECVSEVPFGSKWKGFNRFMNKIMGCISMSDELG